MFNNIKKLKSIRYAIKCGLGLMVFACATYADQFQIINNSSCPILVSPAGDYNIGYELTGNDSAVIQPNNSALITINAQHARSSNNTSKSYLWFSVTVNAILKDTKNSTTHKQIQDGTFAVFSVRGNDCNTNHKGHCFMYIDRSQKYISFKNYLNGKMDFKPGVEIGAASHQDMRVDITFTNGPRSSECARSM